MKVKLFDENHEKDLEASVNNFLSELEGEVIEIKYQVAVGVFSEEQVLCFSAKIKYTSLVQLIVLFLFKTFYLVTQ